MLTQSIGDTSNLSYVFDGNSSIPTKQDLTPQQAAPATGTCVRATLNSKQTRAAVKGVSAGGAVGSVAGAVGGPIYQADNGSISTDSSPSRLQQRNLIYRNVRNYNNLYEK